MTAWAYDVGEPIAAQPTVGHGWVYASTTRGGLVALEVSDASFDGWHMWGGNAQHNGRVLGTEPPAEEDERPSEGTLALEGAAREAVDRFAACGLRRQAMMPVYGMGIDVWTAVITATLGALALGYWIGGRLADARPVPSTMVALRIRRSYMGITFEFDRWAV